MKSIFLPSHCGQVQCFGYCERCMLSSMSSCEVQVTSGTRLIPRVFRTGFALYGEGTGYDSWQYTLFSSRVIPLFGQSQDVHTWHHAVMWVMICFVMIHVYVAIREDIMSRQSLVSTMISGWRTFKDNRKVDDGH